MKLRPRDLSIIIVLAVLNWGEFSEANTLNESAFKSSPEIEYAIGRLETTLSAQGKTLSISSESEADLDLRIEQDPGEVADDGYTLRKQEGDWAIHARNNRGVMYGILDIDSQLRQGRTLETLQEKVIEAHYPFRAIKFNLPWYSYREGQHLALHTETCRDLVFWEAFLDMMLDNKFNVLSLWNMHPYMYMVRPKNFPKASPFTEEEMAEWQAFWHGLFKLAKQRGIDVYVVNWNIFLPEEFSRHYDGGKSYEGARFIGDGATSPAIEQYTREIVTQTLNEYPNLTGIGLTLGERMGGMSSEERRDWVDRTLVAGLKDADRKARLIYRAPLSANTKSGGSVSVTTEQITREAIETLGMDERVSIEFKFNWSHGHTSPRLSIVHGGMLTDTYWTPPSDAYQAIWTMRNEDFFVLRWAQPDFIREFIRLNSQPYTGGCFIGSECYIPAKDYITRDEHRHWDYAFERQWLFYLVWGNLLFDPQTPDATFALALEDRFPGVNGAELLRAWILASNCANRLGSFYRATWDATLYSEGFAKNGGKLITVDELIKQPVLDESLYLSIDEFVAQEFQDPTRIDPLTLADQLETDCKEALRLVARNTGRSESPTLEIELNDIICWTWHGRYFAQKLRGAVALARYRNDNNKTDQQAAIAHLTQARDCWRELVAHVEKYNVPVMPYQFDQEYSWRKQLPQVDQDIRIAERD